MAFIVHSYIAFTFFVSLILKSFFFLSTVQLNINCLKQVRVDQGVMAMKKYFTLLRSIEVELRHQIQLYVLSRTALFGKVIVY